MKCHQSLTPEQQALVENHMALIHWVIRRHIAISEGVVGLGYDDLAQEGAIALCHAAIHYRAGPAQFNTYAIAVIRNHLLDYCRRISKRCQKLPTCSLDSLTSEGAPVPMSADESEAVLSAVYTSQILEHGKQSYQGVARLGIEAIELKVKGYSGADIARLYHTRPNHVGAWIARATEKLRKDGLLSDFSERCTEKQAANF